MYSINSENEKTEVSIPCYIENYVDYLNYELYDYNPETNECRERDGGMVLLREYVSDISEAQALKELEEELLPPIREKGVITPETITEVEPSQILGLNI